MSDYTDNQICLLALTKVRAQFQLGTNQMQYLCPSLRWEINEKLSREPKQLRATNLVQQLRREILSHISGLYIVEEFIRKRDGLSYVRHHRAIDERSKALRLEILDKLVADYAVRCDKEEQPCLM
ncbi:hypothetical protein [Ferribacterium limneticum]|uniref:hypothetical protein n=1 Tax=Ferribacterium limneticum TaxID=76259 RepID=UPI001CF81BEF|nr:hypothetical protein [Ferribacterium limneticum]UCV26759.1 hypothetical protein KI617_10600 [Ferribacterium limneticum]UCV30676.1 hypothetical protein KI608_10600 [Ferribacterium limneticum]